ncbi:MAG: phosphoglycerate dehydrogenase [bacterium]
MTPESKSFSLSKDKIRVLLLEGIHENGLNYFVKNDYTNILCLKQALSEEELISEIKNVHLVGIRSRTLLTDKVLKNAKKLIAIGCYSIGTNQVDLHSARMHGMPVFNAPFSNTRSVAELVIAESIFLLRGIPEKNYLAHIGNWSKEASNSYEVRGKNLGIVGYGHIGSQVSILAESLGMNVYYYDIVKKLSLGNARVCSSLDELLEISDIVTLHVPETELTKNMIAQLQIEKMKKGSLLINASRGTVVNVDDLDEALNRKHLFGAAIDVFPSEPESNAEKFFTVLQKHQNVILTPHIGGSTREAQANIALEVSEKLVNYSNIGATLGATNFVQISLAPNYERQRYLHIHHNKPGVMNKITKVFTSRKLNIASQYLQTDPYIGYVIIDIDTKEDWEKESKDILEELKVIPGTIKARVIK